ncbi:MAG: alpha/beta fold hydrolase [Bacillota bacterium]
MRLVLLFPGWGTAPELYNKLDLEESEVLTVYLFNQQEILREVNQREPTEIILFGWSLGTLMALEYLSILDVDRLILLAPTLYFLENQPRAIVRRMLKNLRRDKLGALIEFSQLNFYREFILEDYLTEYQSKLEQLDVDYLEEGLKRLIVTDLRELEQIRDIEPLIITASEDEIITNQSSKRVVEKFESVTYHQLEQCGHNLIYEANEEVNRLIRGYLDD